MAVERCAIIPGQYWRIPGLLNFINGVSTDQCLVTQYNKKELFSRGMSDKHVLKSLEHYAVVQPN